MGLASILTTGLLLDGMRRTPSEIWTLQPKRSASGQRDNVERPWRSCVRKFYNSLLIYKSNFHFRWGSVWSAWHATLSVWPRVRVPQFVAGTSYNMKHLLGYTCYIKVKRMSLRIWKGFSRLIEACKTFRFRTVNCCYIDQSVHLSIVQIINWSRGPLVWSTFSLVSQ